MARHFKVLGVVWFDKIGIVLMNNGYVDKAYIGLGTGLDPELDIDHILAWGKPFPTDAAKLMIKVK